MSSSEKLQQFGSALHAVGAVVTLAVLAAMYGLVYMSLGAETTETAATTAAKQQFLESATSITSSHQDLQQQLDKEEARLEELFGRIPATPQESDFLAQLSKLARESGVSIRQFSRGAATDEGTHSGMEVELTADASHEAICRFLDGLAELRRLCHVRALTIDAVADSNVAYPIDMTLRIFFAPLRQTQRQSSRF